jgi:hypothetical protein
VSSFDAIIADNSFFQAHICPLSSTDLKQFVCEALKIKRTDEAHCRVAEWILEKAPTDLSYLSILCDLDISVLRIAQLRAILPFLGSGQTYPKVLAAVSESMLGWLYRYDNEISALQSEVLNLTKRSVRPDFIELLKQKKQNSPRSVPLEQICRVLQTAVDTRVEPAITGFEKAKEVLVKIESMFGPEESPDRHEHCEDVLAAYKGHWTVASSEQVSTGRNTRSSSHGL